MDFMKLRLKDMREDMDITQRTIAEYLNIKQNTYSQYENGHKGKFPLRFLYCSQDITVQALITLLAKLTRERGTNSRRGRELYSPY